jgi:hypothetical protein
MLTKGAVIPQSLQRLATGWTVRGSKPGGKNFPLLLTRPEALGPTQLRVKQITELFPGGKAAGRVVDQPAPPSAEVNEA